MKNKKNIENKSPGKTSKKKLFPVAAIGASAGGLEAIELFFQNMPVLRGISFVIIQHLSPDYKSIMGELLGRYTSMKIVEIENGMPMEPDTVYFNQPNKDIRLSENIFYLIPPDDEIKIKLPIDSFFHHLAQDKGEQAIGIILSGTGSDGTLGIKSIKAAGGLTMAQEGSQAKYDSMPRSAIRSGYIDFVLPVEMMPKTILSYLEHPAIVNGKIKTGAVKDYDAVIFKILMLMQSATGHDLTHYKQNTIRRRIERRMAICSIIDIGEYLLYLQDNPAELQQLFKDMLIGVTSFFREPGAFEFLENRIFPEIVKNKEKDSSIRVWVPGCSTGEEAVSIAILLFEVIGKSKKNISVQIFATDLDPETIEKARRSEFPESIATFVSPERLKLFFTKKDGTYKVKKQLREMIVFAVQNIISDPPFSRLDFISCRNLLIYLGSKLQKKVIPTFYYTLDPGGYLFLGSSESIGEFSDLFKTVNVKWKIFQAKKATARKLAQYPILPSMDINLIPGDIRNKKYHVQSVKSNKEVIESILLNDYSPSCVLVNEKYEILYFWGKTDEFLNPPVGEPTYNILKIAHEGLRHKLAAGLYKAVQQKKMISSNNIKIAGQNSIRTVNITIRPVDDQGKNQNQFVVLFENKENIARVPEKINGKTSRSGNNAKRISELEHEVVSTREYLQTIIEELETSNEELKSTNEELQSTNEELQSTNEEMVTAREELQSTNEELITVNSELQNKVAELGLLNSDINNLLDSTEVGTIFLDSSLRIRRFTPSMTDFFNLLPVDIGRSIRDINLKISNKDIYGKIEAVLATLQSWDDEIQARDGRWFWMRLLPYRTVDNIIDGVVITVSDITDRKRAEMLIQDSLIYTESILETVREPLLILNSEFVVQSANRSFYKNFNAAIEETVQKKIYDLGNGQWNIPELKDLLERIIPENNYFENFVVEYDFQSTGKKRMLLNARRIINSHKHAGLILLAIEDVTEKSGGGA